MFIQFQFGLVSSSEHKSTFGMFVRTVSRDNSGGKTSVLLFGVKNVGGREREDVQYFFYIMYAIRRG